MPFDRFTIEQIAGDLLPDATDRAEDRDRASTATRMINEEGGDRRRGVPLGGAGRTGSNTTATVWLGMTIGCAQCHNHKYDPFTQKEYYRLFAFFDHSDVDRVRAPAGCRIRRGAAARP